MGAYKREAAFLVHFGDVLDNPGFGGMAALAVGAHGLVVHVGMAVHAAGTCFGEHQALVALPAFSGYMLSLQRHFSGIVIERVYRLIKGPAFRTVAEIAAQLEIFAVR